MLIGSVASYYVFLFLCNALFNKHSRRQELTHILKTYFVPKHILYFKGFEGVKTYQGSSTTWHTHRHVNIETSLQMRVCVCVSCFFSLDVALTCWNERIRLLTASRQRAKTLRAYVCGCMTKHNTHTTDMSSGPGSPVPWCRDTSWWVGVMFTTSRHWVFPLDRRRCAAILS
jgi:hypothetical protein